MGESGVDEGVGEWVREGGEGRGCVEWVRGRGRVWARR